MELSKLKELLRENGIVGAGGAGFPTYAKLSEKAETVILNCAECEPLLKLHRQVLERYAAEILGALSEIVKAVGAKNGIVAVKEHYKDTLEAVQYEIGEYPSLSVCKLKSVYPSGDELILIKDVTGKTVSPGALPISVGVIVCNVETVYNVYKALQGEPVTEKFVTVAGEVKNPMTLRVPVGTEVSELIKTAGGVTTEEPTYIFGGLMMGKIGNKRDPVTKTTNAVIVLPSDHSAVLNKKRNPKISLRRAMSVCCQCHSCTDLCSRHIAGYPVEPHMVMRIMSNGGKGDLNIIPGAMFCSGCGLCETYSCPQGLSPRALIDEIKAVARANGIKPAPMELLPNDELAEYRRVSVDRLTGRLGVKKYDLPAPITEEFGTDKVKILLSQHIGAPSVATVKVGDEVKKGSVIAEAKEGALGVNIHASIDGTVTALTEKYVVISKK